MQIKHVYYEDKGFRAGEIRNKAVLHYSGDYIIFLDRDCVTLPNFIYRHRKFAQSKHFVPGNRVLVTQSFTQSVIEKNILLHKASFFTFLKYRFQNKINRLLHLIYLPFHQFIFSRPRY